MVVRKLVPLSSVMGLVLVDQLSKVFIGRTVSEPVRFFDFVQIVNIRNTGTVFGLFQGTATFLVALALISVAALVFYFPKLVGIQRHAAIMLIAGMIGNTVDRLIRGYVTDFIYLRPWPAFNFSDILLTAGVLVFALSFKK